MIMCTQISSTQKFLFMHFIHQQEQSQCRNESETIGLSGFVSTSTYNIPLDFHEL